MRLSCGDELLPDTKVYDCPRALKPAAAPRGERIWFRDFAQAKQAAIEFSGLLFPSRWHSQLNVIKADDFHWGGTIAGLSISLSRGDRQLSGQHPLRSRLGWAGAGNYQWLEQYAKKLHTATGIPGFGAILSRLGQPSEYVGAFSEVEIALKLRLAGLEVSFVPPGDLASPDLTVKAGRTVFNLEVTSLNPPDEESRATDLMSGITVAQMMKAVTGGYISRAPSHKELGKLADSVTQAIREAYEKRTIVRVNVPGLALIYVAHRDLASSLPEDCRGSFRFIQPYPRSVEERLGRILRNKAKQTFIEDRPGLLVVYARMIGLEGATSLYEDLRDDIGAVISSFPRLTGLIVTAPLSGVGVPEGEEKRVEGDRTLLYSRPSVDEFEATVIWRNPHADVPMPIQIQEAFENYSEHQKGLSPLPRLPRLTSNEITANPYLRLQRGF